MGIFLLTSVYCLMGLSIAPGFWFIVGLTALAVDDTVIRQRNGCTPRFSSIFCSIAALASELCLVAFSNHSMFDFRGAVDRGDWFTIGTGILLPVVAPLVAYSLRSPGGHTASTIVRYMHFGTPSAILFAGVFLGATHLQHHSTTFIHQPHPMRARALREPLPRYTQQPHAMQTNPFFEPNATLIFNNSNSNAYRVSHATFNTTQTNLSASNLTGPALERPVSSSTHQPKLDYKAILIPFTMVPAIFLTLQAILDYMVLDVICVMAVMAASKHMLLSPTSYSSGPALIAALLALGGRLYVLSHTNIEKPLTLYEIPHQTDEDDEFGAY